MSSQPSPGSLTSGSRGVGAKVVVVIPVVEEEMEMVMVVTTVPQMVMIAWRGRQS